MVKPSIEDVLQQGIHGQKETKPEERRKFLGTLRERILVALTKDQVYKQGTFPEVEKLMKEYPDARLYMNGNMAYEDFSKYLKMANDQGIEYTIVANKEHDTDIGLVLACHHAVDKEEIYIKSALVLAGEPAAGKKSFMKKLWGWVTK